MVQSAKWPGWYGQNIGVDGMGLRCFIKKVLLSFEKFTGKHLHYSLLLNNVAG